MTAMTLSPASSVCRLLLPTLSVPDLMIFLRCIAILLVLISVEVVAQDDAPQGFLPQTAYFNSFLKREDAKKLAADGKPVEAEQALRSALQLLFAIRNVHPEFEPELVADRITETEALLDEIAPKATAVRNAARNRGADIVGGAENQRQPIADAARQQRQNELDRLYKQITDLRTDLRRAEAERTDDRAKLRTALQQLEDERQRKANAPLVAEVERLRQSLEIATQERDALALAFKQTRAEKVALQAENARLVADREELREKNAELARQVEEQRGVNNSVVRGLRRQQADLGEQLDEKDKALAASRQQILDLTARVNQAQQTIAELTSERDDLLTERDEMQELLKLGQSERTQELITQNMLLGRQLREQQEKLSRMVSEDSATKAQLTETLATLRQTKVKLVTLNQQNADQKRRLVAYERRLADAEAQLAAGGGGGSPADARNLEILRSALQTAQRQQVVRQKAATALVEAVKKQGVFDELAGPIRAALGAEMTLTDEQKILLENPNPDLDGGIVLDATGAAAPTAVREAAERRLAQQVSSFTRAGRRAYVAGRYQIASELFEIALEEHPGHVESLINLGVSSLRMGDLSKAEDCFANAITMRETSYYAHQMLGATQYESGKYDAAKENFEQALLLRQDNPQALSFLGTIAAINGQLDDAEQHYLQALDLDKDLPTPLYNLARIFAARGDQAKARDYYERALSKGADADPELESQILE